MAGSIAEVRLNSGHSMPAVGLGTASSPIPKPDIVRKAVLDAIAVGHRHFDTASVYGTELPIGEAVAEALHDGLIKSRDELFITSKLWGTDAHPDRLLPALHRSLKNLQLEYLDLYLIHWPLSIKSKEPKRTFDEGDIIPIDLESIWPVMEECQRLGLVRSIGVSNFSCKKLDQVLSLATIPPSVNQVEMNPIWQQKNLIKFCKERGIHVSAYSPLGANGTAWGTDKVMECNVLKEIAVARGKSVAQVSLRWIYQQGASIIVKTYNMERMKENIDIFDWELSKEELMMISQLKQIRGNVGDLFVSATGPFKSIDDLWDGEI